METKLFCMVTSTTDVVNCILSWISYFSRYLIPSLKSIALSWAQMFYLTSEETRLFLYTIDGLVEIKLSKKLQLPTYLQSISIFLR